MTRIGQFLYDRHAKMSYEEKQEMWARESYMEEQRDLKAEWESECRRDEEMIRRYLEKESE